MESYDSEVRAIDSMTSAQRQALLQAEPLKPRE
jgi:hypothetical protein